MLRTRLLAITILYPILVVIFVGIFWYNKSSSVFLRKRSLYAVMTVALWTLVSWSITVLYDYIGSKHYPCWLFMLLSYGTGPAVFTPGLIIVLEYVTTMSSIRMNQKLSRKQQRLAESSDADPKLLPSSSDVNLDPEISFDTIRKRVRATYFSSRTEEDLIGNLKFYKTRFGIILYFIFGMGLYVIAFVARFIMTPQWATCSGCELASVNAGLLIGITVFTQSIAWTSNTTKVKRMGALRLIREWIYTWAACG